MSNAPSVTIGMPLYNNARTVERAVRSLLDQTYRDFELIVSDDGSKDATVDIVSRIAESDSRIFFHRQPKNLNYGNFRFVLECCRSPFFMFAPGDDVWDSTFLSRCIDALQANPIACCVTPQVQFFGTASSLSPGSGTFALTGSVEENVARYIRGPNDNSRMYGLFRTDAAKRAFPTSDHHAFDWTFSAASLRDGHHLEIPAVLMHRDTTPSDRYVEYVRRDNSGIVNWLFPLLPMTRSLLFEKKIPLSMGVIRSLVRINWEHHLSYSRRYHPRYAAFVGPLLSRVMHRV